MNARLLKVHFAPVAGSDERKLVLCDVEIINDSIVAHAKPEFGLARETIRIGYAAQWYCWTRTLQARCRSIHQPRYRA